MKPPLPQLKEVMHRAYASFPSPQAVEFAHQIRSADREEALGQVSSQIVAQTPDAIRRLRDTIAAHMEALATKSQSAELELASLREARDTLDEFHLRRDNIFRQTCELLRLLLPESQLCMKALEFAYKVPVPADDLAKAERHSETAQHHLFDEGVTVARQIFDAQQSETNRLFASTSIISGIDICFRPERRDFRPPEFSAVKYFAQIDLYEMARGTSIGQNLPKNIRPRWLHKFLQRIGRISDVHIESVTAVAAYESLQRRTRAILRRELASIAAEQMRRICTAALSQVDSYHAMIRLDLLAKTRDYFAHRNREISILLFEISKERRKTSAYAASAERMLLEAEGAARRVLSLLSTYGADSHVQNNQKREATSNGLSITA